MSLFFQTNSLWIYLGVSFIQLVVINIGMGKFTGDILKERARALHGSLLVFGYFLVLLFFYDFTKVGYQYLTHIKLNETLIISFGIDGFSLSFLFLITLLFPLILINEWDNPIPNRRNWYRLLWLIETLIILCFLILDFFVFYIFFELLLIPMFVLIIVWGSRTRKIKASLYLVCYTLFGSFLLLLGIFLLYFYTNTTNILLLSKTGFSQVRDILIFLSLFIGFAVKIPIMPFHLWLPEAHVEASTTGSVILAALLLKLGGYGFIRFFFPCLLWLPYFYIKLLTWVCFINIILANIFALRQTDIKKLIAYASIGHMNIALMGVFSFTTIGLKGGILLMLGHGIISSALFFLIGNLYKRFKTKSDLYYSGLINTMPIFSFFWFFFLISNFSFPLTANFISEIMILFQVLTYSPIMFSGLIINLLLGASYSIWLFSRMCLGTIKIIKPDNTDYSKPLSDLKLHEIFVMCILMCLTLLIGIWPNHILNLMTHTIFFIC